MRTLRLFVRDPNADGGNNGDEKDPIKGLQAAVAAERKARQEAEARVAAIEADRKKAEEAAAAKAGEYEKLYAGLKPEHEKLAAKLTEYEKRESERVERVKSRNEERIKALPETGRKAVASLASHLPPEALAEWLDDNAALFGADAHRPAGTQARGAKVEEAIPAECIAEWERFGKRSGISEREWFENTWKPRHKAKGAA